MLISVLVSVALALAGPANAIRFKVPDESSGVECSTNAECLALGQNVLPVKKLWKQSQPTRRQTQPELVFFRSCNRDFQTTTTSTFTPPTNGRYTVTVIGARGGRVIGGAEGGAGWNMTATIFLESFKTYNILVGCIGQPAASSSASAGGGGGSSFWEAATGNSPLVPLLIAGGGGGSTTAAPGLAAVGPGPAGGGAVGGNGGASGGLTGGGGGGGFYQDGESAGTAGVGGEGGMSRGSGGNGVGSGSTRGGNGGFGGGGSGASVAGGAGGGGGYSGGNGGGAVSPAGGGSSFADPFQRDITSAIAPLGGGLITISRQ